MKSDQYSFASDNCAGVHPVVMEGLMKVNQGYVHSYGDDVYTQEARDTISQHFGGNAAVQFVYNGTGANVTAITHLIRSFHTVFCSQQGHIHVDECGSLEHYCGCKVVALPSKDGKLSPGSIDPLLVGIGDEHRSQPGLISITQPTEYGVLYSPEEIGKLADFAHEHNMLLHMDGARIANAADALKLPLKSFTKDCGVDVVSLGATKNGLMFGEAVVFMNKAAETCYPYIRKQGMQLHSKMRFIAAQFQTLFATDLWLDNASHANAMARRLLRGLRDLPGISITQDSQCNALFAVMPKRIIPALQQRFHFYTWDEENNEVRLMTSFQTTEVEVDALISGISQALRQTMSGGR